MNVLRLNHKSMGSRFNHGGTLRNVQKHLLRRQGSIARSVQAYFIKDVTPYLLAGAFNSSSFIIAAYSFYVDDKAGHGDALPGAGRGLILRVASSRLSSLKKSRVSFAIHAGNWRNSPER